METSSIAPASLEGGHRLDGGYPTCLKSASVIYLAHAGNRTPTGGF